MKALSKLMLTVFLLGGCGEDELEFTSLTVGGYHTCGVAADGRAFCWGDGGEYGQLGNGENFGSPVPVLVDVSGVNPPVTFAALTAGQYHTCGLATDGRAFCWGSDLDWQLGNGDGSDSLVPGLVEGGIKFTLLTAGEGHTCGIATDGRAFCWGSDRLGKLGNGTGGSSEAPVLVDVSGISPPISFESLTAGGYHTCGLSTDGSAFCWGGDGAGQLGNGAGESSEVPVLVDVSGISPPISFESLTAGSGHTCGVASDGRAFCWGDGTFGQLGNDGVVGYSQMPVPVDVSDIDPPVFFKELTAGYDHTCGVASDGRAFCWGRDSSGKLGNGGDSDDSKVPVLVDGWIRFTALTAGVSHTCGLSSDGRAFCWGADINGRLGNGGEWAPNTCILDMVGVPFPCSQTPVRVDVSGIH